MKSTFSFLAILFSLAVAAQSIRLGDLRPEEITSQGFFLSTDATVRVEGSGAIFYEDWKAIIYYGWIVDSESREVVWHLFDVIKDKDSQEKKGQIDFSANLNLKKGNYEAYFAAAYSNGNDWNNWGNTWAVKNFDDVVDKIFSSRDRQKYRTGYSEDFYLKVSSNNLRRVEMEELLAKKIASSIISFTKVGDDESLRKGFSLSAETDLKVYAVGEVRRDEVFDYLWIYDAETREVVFEMDYDNTDFAGGAEKNLKFDDEVTLPKGNYVVSYVTDDSHSYDKWNALPPDDPNFWGATIWPATVADGNNVIPYREPKTITPLVDLTRIRDDKLVSQGISIQRDMKVRILSIGEGTGDGSMADYGWIMDANTREKVWTMPYSRTDYAGGASKNRKASDVITLPKGDYIVYYATDDSHSYNDWNASRPHEKEMWGITVWAIDEADLGKATAFSPSSFVNKNSLVEILMVRDDEYIRESFVLDEDTRVRILAVGEGSSGEMYDYGVIKDESGRTVWEMEYRDTDHAGGANKNREISDQIFLEKGTYKVIYRTDGSHSYSRWNASPPSDQEMWGIMVLKE